MPLLAQRLHLDVSCGWSLCDGPSRAKPGCGGASAVTYRALACGVIAIGLSGEYALTGASMLGDGMRRAVLKVFAVSLKWSPPCPPLVYGPVDIERVCWSKLGLRHWDS